MEIIERRDTLTRLIDLIKCSTVIEVLLLRLLPATKDFINGEHLDLWKLVGKLRCYRW